MKKPNPIYKKIWTETFKTKCRPNFVAWMSTSLIQQLLTRMTFISFYPQWTEREKLAPWSNYPTMPLSLWSGSSFVELGPSWHACHVVSVIAGLRLFIRLIPEKVYNLLQVKCIGNQDSDVARCMRRDITPYLKLICWRAFSSCYIQLCI